MLLNQACLLKLLVVYSMVHGPSGRWIDWNFQSETTPFQILEPSPDREDSRHPFCALPDDGPPPAPESFEPDANSQPLVLGSADAKSEPTLIDFPENPLRSSSPAKRVPATLASSRSDDDSQVIATSSATEDEAKTSRRVSKPVDGSLKNEPTKPEEDLESDKQKRIAHHREQSLQESPELVEEVESDEEVRSNRYEMESRAERVPVPVIEVSGDRKNSERSFQNETRSKNSASRQQLALQERIEGCLSYYLMRPESVAKRSPWAVMHGMLPFGVEAQVAVGNKQANAIGWMCSNGKCRVQKLFVPKGNSFAMAVGPGVQGHEGQFLAMLAQSHVPSSYPIQVEQTTYHVGDLVQYEMGGCKEKSELTFKLIGLSHYLPSDQTWMTPDRKRWNIAKIIEEELDQPIVGAACGGTHRLMGLTYAVQRRAEQGLPINGQFLRAKQFTTDFVPYAFSMQNPDGSFSTDWFEQRANDSDRDRKVQTTGHILEWLVYTVPDDQLNDPRILRAIQFLLSQLLDDRNHEWAIGPRGHSLRALALYDQRVFGRSLGRMREELAQGRPGRAAVRR